jgi:hypothetical protein
VQAVPPEDDAGLQAAARVIHAWHRTHRPDVVVGLNDYVYWTWRQCLPEACPPFVSLSTDSPGTIAGLETRWDEVGKVAAELMDQQLRQREFGTPEERHLRLVPGRWCDGLSLPTPARA